MSIHMQRHFYGEMNGILSVVNRTECKYDKELDRLKRYSKEYYKAGRRKHEKKKCLFTINPKWRKCYE